MFEKTQQSRRSFVATGGATAAITAFAGVSSVHAAEAAPENSTFDEETDVLVVGAGFGGLVAAASALDAGANVIIVDASTRVGSSSLLSSGVMTTHGSNSVEELSKNAPLTDPVLGKAFLDAWPVALDWLAKIGAPLSQEDRQTDSGSYPIYRLGGQVGTPGNVAYAAFFENYVTSNGGKIELQTKAKRLITDDDGAVIGAKVTGPTGPYTIGASQVILACGGTQNNKEMNVKYIGPNADLMVSRGNPHNAGSGLLMAQQVGGIPSRGHGTFYGHPVPLGASVTEDTATWDENITDDSWLARVNSVFTIAQNSGASWGVVVNLNGKRFFDESQDDLKLNQEIGRQKFARAYEVIDSDIRAQHTGMSSTLGDDGNPIEDLDLLSKWGAELIEANTLEDLANQLESRGVNRANFLRTVQEYNSAVDEGTTGELDIPKSNADKAAKLAQPPFYAFGVVAGYSFSFGGVKTDEDGRVVDAVDDPIPGLWAIPGTSGGMQYDYYIGVISTMTAMGHLAGTIAGQEALGA
ncbi:MAG: FAD-binding protein [Coriobacteriales bacterium]|jgi:fumarate reductase flavoprotein subunit